ncbi:MAG: hypothetical protein PHN82_01605 [bacterium]|nr:hypothetical protein [bacterium]
MYMRALASALLAAAIAAGPARGAVSLGVFLDGAPDAQITGLFGATRPHAIVQYALVWAYSNAGSHTELMNRVRGRNATPMCVWGSGWERNLNDIANGAHDAYITGIANAVRDFGHPVILAFNAEFNLTTNPYNASHYGNDAGAYIAAWRHVVDRFRAAGATNAQWAWCPNYASNPPASWNQPENYYPGDEYVDWLGTLGFDCNWAGGGGTANLSFNDLFGPILSSMASLKPDKPQIVMWFATAGSAAQKPAWIQSSYGSMANYPNLRAVVWYNKRDDAPANADYRVWDTAGVQASVTNAYRNAISAPLFLTTLPPYDELVPNGNGNGGGGTLAITPSPVTVWRGDTLSIGWAFQGITQRVDAYLRVTTPEDDLYYMDARQQFNLRVAPVASNYNVSGNPSGTLRFTVPRNISAGDYTFEAMCVPAGRSVADPANWIGGADEDVVQVR